MFRKIYVVGYSFIMQVKMETRVKQRVWDWFNKFWHIYIMEHGAAIKNHVVDLVRASPKNYLGCFQMQTRGLHLRYLP